MFITQQCQHNIPFINTELIGGAVIVHHIDIRFIVSGGVGAGRWYITGGSILGSRPYFHIQIGGFSPNLVTIKSQHVYMYYTHSFASPSIYGCPWFQKQLQTSTCIIHYSLQTCIFLQRILNIKEKYKKTLLQFQQQTSWEDFFPCYKEFAYIKSNFFVLIKLYST